VWVVYSGEVRGAVGTRLYISLPPYSCVRQVYGDIYIYRIYYIKNNDMFRPFSLAIIRLINEKLSKQLHSTCVGLYSGEVRGAVGMRLYIYLTQLYGGIDMYNLLHKEQLHVSALFIGHLQVDK